MGRLGGIPRVAPPPADRATARFLGAAARVRVRSVPSRAGVGRLLVAALPSWADPWASAEARARARACYARIGAPVQVRPGNQLRSDVGGVGMSRRLLKFGGGSGDDYATWRSSSVATRPSCAVACAQGVDQRRHVSIPLQPTEALDGLEDACGHPAQHHVTAPPALDVPFHKSRAADETFGRVRGRERAPQARRQLQREDGERLIEALADALGGAGILGLEAPRQIEQEPLRRSSARGPDRRAGGWPGPMADPDRSGIRGCCGSCAPGSAGRGRRHRRWSARLCGAPSSHRESPADCGRCAGRGSEDWPADPGRRARSRSTHPTARGRVSARRPRSRAPR